MKANVKHKNSVFSFLFSDEEALHELYSAVKDIALPPDAQIDINTLADILFMDQINDVSYTIDNRLVVLIEHQSTINENLPLRLLLYIARVYEKIIDQKKRYQTKLVEIPTPEFIVLYNGRAKFPEYKTMKLSDAFKKVAELTGEASLELVVPPM